MAMEYVLTEDGKAVKLGENGHPLVKDGENEPYELDALHLNSKIPELQKEAKNHRLKAKELQEKLDNFEGIDDPKKAKEALKTVQNLEDKQLIDAGKAEDMKKQIQDQYEQKLSEKDQALSERDQQIHKLVVSNAFASSPTINEKTVLPPDVAEAYFGRHFQVENGRAVAYDANGNQIFSREKPGEPAPFDEAVNYLLENHPQKDRLMKGSPPGGGTPPGGRAGKQAKTISRSQFNELSADQQHQFVVVEGGQVVDQ